MLSRIVEDVKTLDADATDDDVRHHLDRLQRAINREYNSGQVPVVGYYDGGFVHCSAARQVKMHTARAQYLMESMRRKGSTTSQGSSLSSESGRPRSSRHSWGGRSGSAGAATARLSGREVRIEPIECPTEIAVDRAQLSAAELAEEIAREKDSAARAGTLSGVPRWVPRWVPRVPRDRGGPDDSLSERPGSAAGVVDDDGERDPSTRTFFSRPRRQRRRRGRGRRVPGRGRAGARTRRYAGAPAVEMVVGSVVAIAASVGHAHEPPDYGPKASETLRLRAHTWRDFDMFAFADDLGPERCGERGGGPLMAVGVAILDRHGVFERLGVERDSCAAFFAGLHCLYMRRGGIYHGPMHAADVLQAAGVLLDELHPHSLPEGAT